MTELALGLRRRLDVENGLQRRLPPRALHHPGIRRVLTNKLVRLRQLLLAAVQQVHLVEQDDVGDGELLGPRLRAVEEEPGGAVARRFRVHDAHDGVQTNPRHLPERLIQRCDRLGGIDEAGGLYEEVVDVSDVTSVVAPVRTVVEHAPDLRLELPAEGAAEASVGELDDALDVLTGADAGHDAVVVASDELGVDVELGEVVDDAGDAQILAVREHVAHHRGLAAAEPAGDEGGGQAAALLGHERGAELVVAEEVHRVLLASRPAGGRGGVDIGARTLARDRSHRSHASSYRRGPAGSPA